MRHAASSARCPVGLLMTTYCRTPSVTCTMSFPEDKMKEIEPAFTEEETLEAYDDISLQVSRLDSDSQRLFHVGGNHRLMDWP
jgi:hypothetical protein